MQDRLFQLRIHRSHGQGSYSIVIPDLFCIGFLVSELRSRRSNAEKYTRLQTDEVVIWAPGAIGTELATEHEYGSSKKDRFHVIENAQACRRNVAVWMRWNRRKTFLSKMYIVRKLRWTKGD